MMANILVKKFTLCDVFFSLHSNELACEQVHISYCLYWIFESMHETFNVLVWHTKSQCDMTYRKPNLNIRFDTKCQFDESACKITEMIILSVRM